jgi:4-amino-4-deoxy-L-arabinose transferase-like glycosyltransferase
MNGQQSWWAPPAVRCPIAPLVLVVVINLAFFFAFQRLGHTVGADTGTDGYKEIAESLVRGDGFIFAPDMHSTMMFGYMKREPVYPLLLAGVRYVTGTLNPVVLCLFQTALCVASCYLLFRLGVRIFDARVATVAAYVYALHPISFWYTARFSSEMAAVPVLLLCLLSIERFFADPSRGRGIQLGLALGVAALTKSAYVVLLPLVLFFAVLCWRRQGRQLVAFALIILASYGSVHSLWVARNYALTGRIVPLTTMTGVAFFLGNRIIEQFDIKRQTAGPGPDQWADEMYQSLQLEIEAKQPSLSLPNLEAETDKELMTRAKHLMLTNPLFAVRKVLAGSVLIWFLSDSTAKSLGWAMFQLPLVLLALFGVWAMREWSMSAVFLLCVAVLFLVAYAAVCPYARYSTPVMPLVILFSSCGLLSAFKACGHSRSFQAAI